MSHLKWMQWVHSMSMVFGLILINSIHCFKRDKLGLCADIQIIFGTVWVHGRGGGTFFCWRIEGYIIYTTPGHSTPSNSL